ncbi:urease accessory protein UreF [Bacillus sp. B-jedd]|uniref:urease accessory protein UreF n=1 Tax=Bacillus sp. B-jedd TaxID=1476857 RepID=UPI000662B86E|nr:urease accessory protein UreF [Bacillus sp. B-jedd]
MDKSILPLFQFCDSSFPSGAFSHSYGLETYIQENKVHDAASFQNWLTVYLNDQLMYSDGLASRLAYDAIRDGEYAVIWKLDRLLTVQNLARETREGTMMVGGRMLKLANVLYSIPFLSDYEDRIKKKQSFGHPAIVFTAVAHHLGATSETATLLYLYSAVMNLVQNAVRAIPLGQTAGQKIIHSLHGMLEEAVAKIQELDEGDFGIVSPGLELAQMKHERVNVRIFMS